MRMMVTRPLAVLAMTLALPAAALATPPATGNSPAARAATIEQRRSFTEDLVAPQVAPRGYDVTIVEYTDYQCPYCRLTHDALNQLLATDGKVRIVYRDWPIFGAPSQRAARLAIASEWQGKHAPFHDALMKTPRPLTEASMQAAARKAGVDWARLTADLDAHGFEIQSLLNRNDTQAEALGFEGTPGLIVGSKVFEGALTLKQLRQAVAEARRETIIKPIVPLRPAGI